MKAIVEQYAKGQFKVDRPEVYISEREFSINIEAGTIYEGSFQVESRNDYPIKGMVYDSRYVLRFEDHSFISRNFTVKYSFDATCLEAGQNFRGHINVITDGGEWRLPYDISIVQPCVKHHDEKIDDLFKFASLAERNWNDAARLFVNDDFRRTFIDKEIILKKTYESLLESRSVNQAMEEFLVLVSKKRTVTLSVPKAKVDIAMPTETESITIEISKNTWGYTFSEIRSDSEFIIPSKKTISAKDFTGNVCSLKVFISPEHVPEGENSGKLIIENIYQRIEVDIHLAKPLTARPNQDIRRRNREYKRSRTALTRTYLDFRMDRMSLDEYISKNMEALKTLNEIEPEEDMYRLAIMHMNILSGEYAKVEQEFLRIEADVDKESMGKMQLCYYNYLRAMVLKDDEVTEKTAHIIRRNYRTQEPKMFYFWLLLFVDATYNEDKSALYRELSQMFEEGENSPIIYFELCNLFNSNPMMLKKLTELEIICIKWGLRHKFISDEVLLEFVKLAGRNKDFNKQIFDVLKEIYDKNEMELRAERRKVLEERGVEDSELYDSMPVTMTSTSRISSIHEYDDESLEDISFDFGKYGDSELGSVRFNAEDNDTEDDEDFFIGGMSSLDDDDDDYDDDDVKEDISSADSKSNGIRDDKFDAAIRADAAEKLTRRENENLEVLSSICSMLISANMLDHKYHRFYKAAVLKSLKFIGLNECYIRSMNRDKYDLIPTSVLMYLNYKNTLTEDELAYLYANVIFNKSEHMKIYHEYAPTMEDFMENMIIRGKVNDDLTVIYDEFLEPENVSSLYAGKLINIIFRRKIVCNNKNVAAVIVSHEELQAVQRIPLVNGEAYVEILSDNASIIFEDKNGNRYAGSIPYHFERIVDEKAYMPICREYSPRDYRVLLFNYESLGQFTYKNAKEVNAAREIIQCDEISYDYKQQACLNIIEYYHENLDTDVLIKYLSRLDIEFLSHANARTVITYLIDMNMFDKAFQAVKLYGFNELDVNELYRLADYGVTDSEGFLNEDLMSICINLYKTGTVNSNILGYLVSNFKGSIEELADLFKLSKDRVADIGPLAENTLAQMMFSDTYIEYIYDVFLTYYSGRSRGLVVKAFARLSAHNYLVRDDQVPSFIFDALFQEVVKGNIDDEISIMSLLLYFSKLERFTDLQRNWIVDNVEKFVDAGKILPFFKNFASFIRLPQDIFLKTYLIYKSDRQRQVYVKYSFDTGTRNKQKTERRRLEEVVSGVYVLEFVVFHGERLVYSIEDDPNGNAKIVESEVLKKRSFSGKSLSRFERINSMLVKQEMRKDKELLEDLDVYINTVHLFEETLKIL
ncbi:hypothetical protein SAMN02910369_02469 [Lachnospiraceae bacterium NE2001]|nr:hypothetical protein SAMN02910369_02469 [Lachnospiraceae bacterium NE2001]